MQGVRGGPLKPVIEVHPGFPEWTVYRPEPLDAETKHPIVVFGNGGCLLELSSDRPTA
jgi:hypothetical protein